MNQQPQRYYIEGKDIQEEKLLSEGGYGYIWRAIDTRTGQVYALKKMICQGSDRIQVAQNELNILKRLPNHPNLVNYHGSLVQKHSEERVVFLILMEFCSGGSLFDLMAKDPNARFPEQQILGIVKDVVQGIKAMHAVQLAHRDIKIENVLYQNGKYKLCDFGSASPERVDFTYIDKSEFYKYEEFYEKNTTLMYRPPEMADLFLRYQVNEKVDIWMLGCVIFTLCFFVHPFAESQKLAVVNAAYNIPQNSKYSSKLIDFIRLMLTPNPKFRPSITDIEQIIQNWNSIQTIQLNQNQPQAQEIKNKHLQAQKEMESYEKNLKKFDGDIPMDELLKLQQRIRQEQEQQENQSRSKPTMGRGQPQQKPRQPIPQPKQQNSEWGKFGQANSGNVLNYLIKLQFQWGQDFQQPQQQQRGNQSSWEQPAWNWNESFSQPSGNQQNAWEVQPKQSQQNLWTAPKEQTAQNINFSQMSWEQPQQDLGWGTQKLPQQNQINQQNQFQNQNAGWGFQQPTAPINQQQSSQLPQTQNIPAWPQNSGFQAVQVNQPPPKQFHDIDLIGLDEKKEKVDLSNIIL